MYINTTLQSVGKSVIVRVLRDKHGKGGGNVGSRREIPIVTQDQFRALHLFAVNYEILAILLTDFTTEQIIELVENGYQTKG